MVNRFKGRFWFFLLVFGLYLSCPGYPESIKVKNLPANQDMDEQDQEYGEDTVKGKWVLTALECSACKDGLNETAKCNKCVGLEEACPDCCLSDDLTAIRCSETDASGDYNCSVAPFGNAEDCGLVECDDKKKDDYQDCMSKCTNGSGCKAKGTGGSPKTSDAYGLQRRGCPEEDNDGLAPNGSCTLLSGSGLDRKWKCPSGNLPPKSGGCVPDAETGLSKPDTSAYYAVTKAEPGCTSSCSTSPCTSGCSSASTGCRVLSACTPSCSSSCTPSCSSSCYSNCSSPEPCSASCSSSCNTTGSCWPGCSKEQSCPPKGGKCSSWCTQSSCDTGCSSSCTPEDVFYIYTLSQEVKDYIRECISYADKYEKCADRLHCCQEGVCPEETDSEDKCSPGFDLNCDRDSCENRICDEYVKMCKNYTGGAKTISCAQMASDANGCLGGKSDCFKEIDPGFKYDFATRSGDALTIIWQIINKPVTKDVRGVNFYTLVKMFEADKDKVEPAAHTSMMNVKSLEAAFSIYGTTHVKRGELEPGKSYRVRVYYFLPEAEFCNPACETCSGGTIEVELDYMSLILLRVRE